LNLGLVVILIPVVENNEVKEAQCRCRVCVQMRFEEPRKQVILKHCVYSDIAKELRVSRILCRCVRINVYVVLMVMVKDLQMTM